jgi:hydroxysqualene dehydroxylase
MTTSEIPQKVEVAIIGGGLSGLAAAVELVSNGVDVALFEQSPRLGGRCYSYIDSKTGDVVENGQHVLLGAYHNTLRYLKMVGTRDCLHHERRLVLPFHHPTKGRAVFALSSLPKPFHLTAGMLKCKLLSFNDRQKLLKVGFELNGWNSELEKKLSTLTIDQWLTGLHQSEEAKQSFWYPVAISVMNESPQKASALLFARSLKAAFMGKKSDSAFLIPSIGQTELYASGAEMILKNKKSKFFLNTEVQTILVENSKAIGLQIGDGKTVRANNIISAVPYFSLHGLIPNKFRSETPFADLHRFESSAIISIHLWFDQDIMDVPYIGLIGKDIQWIFNRRRIMKVENNKTGYLSAVISAANDFVNLSKAELVAMALNNLREAFPESGQANLIHSIVIKEKRATFSPTNDVECFRPTTESPIRNLFLAGDWTATGLPPTIEGAVLSGFRAVALINK